MVVNSWSDHRENWRSIGFSNGASPKNHATHNRVTVVGELGHSAIDNDTAREFVRCAQIPALVVAVIKECWNVKMEEQSAPER